MLSNFFALLSFLLIFSPYDKGIVKFTYKIIMQYPSWHSIDYSEWSNWLSVADNRVTLSGGVSKISTPGCNVFDNRWLNSYFREDKNV